jgi:hypothetical protein
MLGPLKEALKEEDSSVMIQSKMRSIRGFQHGRKFSADGIRRLVNRYTKCVKKGVVKLGNDTLKSLNFTL